MGRHRASVWSSTLSARLPTQLCRHPVVSGCHVVASRGLLAAGTEHELKAGHETATFFIDHASTTERLLLRLIESPGQGERLNAIRTPRGLNLRQPRL